jgi:hypothetical protein
MTGWGQETETETETGRWWDMDANALVWFGLPARDVFARDAPNTGQFLVPVRTPRLRGGGKPSSSSSSTLQQRACSSSVAF